MDPWTSLELHHLRALDALLAERSVTKAARRLAVTQSAVSHTLAHLRRVLGDELLVRGVGGLELTPRAQSLRAPLQQALAGLRDALRVAAWDPATAERTFTFGMADSFTITLLPTLLGILRAEAPGVRLDVLPMPRAGTVAPDPDLALVVGLPARPGLHSRRLLVETFVSAVRADHPAAAGPIDLDTFCALGHALVTPFGEGVSVVDRLLAEAGRERRVQLRIGYFLSAPLVVAASDLVVTLPRQVATAFARLAPLYLFETPLPLPSFPVDLVWPTRLQSDPGHKWMREAVGRALGG